jgi:hypothetical protein
MKSLSKKTGTAAVLLAALALGVGGCNGPKIMAPAPQTNVNVTVAPSHDVQASLLGSTSSILLWNYQTGVTESMQGQMGPFTSGSASGNIVFTVSLPAGGKRVLSLQLNDAPTHTPLAVGAVELDLSSATPDMSATLQLGSVVRQCYVLTAGYDPTLPGWDYFDLSNHTMTCGANNNPDLFVTAGNTNIQIMDPLGNNTVAYLGNGNLVNFDYVPVAGLFTSSSDQSKSLVVNASSQTVSGGGLDLQTGDIYCIKLATLPGAYAWVQVTSPGNASLNVGPNFRYRVSTDPYFSYYQTAADIAAAAGGTECTTWGNCS